MKKLLTDMRMKRILIFILLFASIVTEAQNVISVYTAPTDTASSATGYVPIVRMVAGRLRLYHKTVSSLGGVGSSTDTSSLSSRINAKVNISDTAAAFSKYLRRFDTTAMLAAYLSAINTNTAAIATKASTTSVAVKLDSTVVKTRILDSLAIIRNGTYVIKGMINDGTTDNLSIVNAALAVAPSGSEIVIPAGSYFFSGPLDITTYTKHIRLTILGDIYFASGVDGIKVGNTTTAIFRKQEVNVYGTIYGFNSGSSYDSYTAGVGFTITNATGGHYYIGSIAGWKTAMKMEASGGSVTGSLHNHVRFDIMQTNDTGIVITASGNTANFVNQNYFYGGNIAGRVGVRFTKNTSQVDPFNNNVFKGVCTEAVTGICWDIDYAQANLIYDGRATSAENPGSSARFKLGSTAKYNRIIGYFLNPSDITDAGAFNDFSQSSILDPVSTQTKGYYYDVANQRMGIGAADENSYPYFMPKTTMDIRGNVQIRKHKNYGATDTTTLLYMGYENVINDGGLAKGYAFRTMIPTTDVGSKLLLSEYTGFQSGSSSTNFPTTDFNDVLAISGGNVGIKNISPAYPLDVTGKIHSTDSVVIPSLRITGGSPTSGKVWTATGTNGQGNWAAPGAGSTFVFLASDVTNSDATPNTIADVTALSFPVTSGVTYKFKFYIVFTSAASTTGSRWSVSGPASPTLLNGQVTWSSAASTQVYGLVTAYDVPSGPSAASATAGNVAIIEGVIKPSSSGTVIARFSSEIASSAITAKAGVSYVEYQAVN